MDVREYERVQLRSPFSQRSYPYPCHHGHPSPMSYDGRNLPRSQGLIKNLSHVGGPPDKSRKEWVWNSGSEGEGGGGCVYGGGGGGVVCCGLVDVRVYKKECVQERV